MAELIEASWEVFDMCNTCGTGPKEPCYNLRKSTSRHLIKNTRPHTGRKRLKDE